MKWKRFEILAIACLLNVCAFAQAKPDVAIKPCWPADPELKAYADRQVLAAAPSVIASGDTKVIHELALYFGSISSPLAHELLQRVAEHTDGAGEQARTALTWHPDPADLRASPLCLPTQAIQIRAVRTAAACH